MSCQKKKAWIRMKSQRLHGDSDNECKLPKRLLENLIASTKMASKSSTKPSGKTGNSILSILHKFYFWVL